MKSKITLMAIAAIVSVSTAGVAHAESSAVGLHDNINIGVNARASTSVSANAHSEATSSEMRDERASSSDHENFKNNEEKNERATSTHGDAMSDDHRSVVSLFVQSLLAVANREGGIGQEVRTVAQSQNDSASTTVNAMAKVDGRGSFHTFLTGSDYRNLGVIRSEIATTSANIAKLKVLLSQAKNEADRAELSVQAKALEDSQVKIEAYVKAHESKFSLFGWFNRLFVK